MERRVHTTFSACTHRWLWRSARGGRAQLIKVASIAAIQCPWRFEEREKKKSVATQCPWGFDLIHFHCLPSLSISGLVWVKYAELRRSG